MKCYLHIGTEKTATTTIQRFLHSNREKIYSRGCIYTTSLGQVNNFDLSLASYNSDRIDDLAMIRELYTRNSLVAWQKLKIAELRSELEPLNSDKIVFSSEHIQSRLTEIEEITRLKGILNSVGIYDITVILYIRNPPDLANSLYSTKVKCGETDEIPPPPTDPYYNNICNHRYTLEKYSAVFGQSSIVPRIFSGTDFENSSIVEDFLSVIGIPYSDDFSKPKIENESLSVTGLAVLRRVNQIIPAFVDGKRNVLREGLVPYFEHYYSDTKYVMPHSIYRRYSEFFRDSNEWVRQRYFPERETLFPTNDYPLQTKLQISDKELDKTAMIIASIWIDKQRAILKSAR
ncbi:MAG: hypothetical protein V7711_01160 [Pseudomonadales bacterium]